MILEEATIVEISRKKKIGRAEANPLRNKRQNEEKVLERKEIAGRQQIHIIHIGNLRELKRNRKLLPAL